MNFLSFVVTNISIIFSFFNSKLYQQQQQQQNKSFNFIGIIIIITLLFQSKI
jgi:hypothetical protein